VFAAKTDTRRIGTKGYRADCSALARPSQLHEFVTLHARLALCLRGLTCVQLRLITVLGKSSNLIRVLMMMYTRHNYTSGQDEVPARTEECLCVRSKNRHDSDRSERLASWLWRAFTTIPTTRICYITRSDRLVYTRPNYTSCQGDVPTRTEECPYVRSKNRHEADRDERLASWL
jgi:hypothetical protein